MNWRDALDSEMRWILDLVGGKTTPLPDGLNVRRLLDLLIHHRLLLLVAGRLGTLLPAPDREIVSDLQQRALRTSLARTHGLLRLMELFDRAGIPVLTIKGPAYGAQILKDPIRRGGQDVDLLVQPPDEARALALLEELGYRTVGPVEWKSRTLSGPEDWPPVDLHIHLASQEEVLDLRDLRPFERAVKVEIADKQLSTLPPDDAVIYAAYHGLRHAWARLHWAYDLLAALDHPDLDWSAIFARAEVLGCERHLAAGLVFVAEAFDRPLPPVLTQRQALLTLAHSIAATHLAHLNDPVSERGMRASAPLRHLLIELRLHYRWRERWAILRMHLSPAEEDRVAHPLPKGFGGLYLPLKVLRILRRKYRLRQP
jgi:hypothetical protein